MDSSADQKERNDNVLMEMEKLDLVYREPLHGSENVKGFGDAAWNVSTRMEKRKNILCCVQNIFSAYAISQTGTLRCKTRTTP